MSFKKLYEQLALDLLSINRSNYKLIPKKELNSIDFIMGGSPREYIGIQRDIGSFSTAMIILGKVHSLFGDIFQVRIKRTINIVDFRKSPCSHNFEYQDAIFNIYGTNSNLSLIAKKIEEEINQYETIYSIKLVPSKALSKIIGPTPIDKHSAWDLLSKYIISNSLVTNNKTIYLDSLLQEVIGTTYSSINSDVMLKAFEDNLSPF